MKILGKDYTVRTIKTFKDFEARLNGIIDYNDLTITIEKDLPKDNQCEILLHEIIHGISKSYEIDLSESQVVRLANGFYAFCKENDTFTYFLEKIINSSEQSNSI